MRKCFTMYTVAWAYSPSSGVCHHMDNIARSCLQKHPDKVGCWMSNTWDSADNATPTMNGQNHRLICSLWLVLSFLSVSTHRDHQASKVPSNTGHGPDHTATTFEQQWIRAGTTVQRKGLRLWDPPPAPHLFLKKCFIRIRRQYSLNSFPREEPFWAEHVFKSFYSVFTHPVSNYKKKPLSGQAVLALWSYHEYEK